MAIQQKLVYSKYKEKSKAYPAFVTQMRKGFLCGMCDWRNHQLINTDTQMIHYNGNTFCKRFFMKWNRFLKNKYTSLLPYAIIFDEFFYLLTHRRLIRYTADRAIIHKYWILFEKANPDGSGPENEELCKEFNLNKFSYLIDGEARMLREFRFNLGKYRKYFTDNDAVPELLKLRESSMSIVDFSKVKKYSVLGDVHEPKPKKNVNNTRKGKDGLVNFGKMA